LPSRPCRETGRSHAPLWDRRGTGRSPRAHLGQRVPGNSDFEPRFGRSPCQLLWSHADVGRFRGCDVDKGRKVLLLMLNQNRNIGVALDLLYLSTFLVRRKVDCRPVVAKAPQRTLDGTRLVGRCEDQKPSRFDVVRNCVDVEAHEASRQSKTRTGDMPEDTFETSEVCQRRRGASRLRNGTPPKVRGLMPFPTS